MLKIAVHAIGEIIIYRPDLKLRFPQKTQLENKIFHPQDENRHFTLKAF